MLTNAFGFSENKKKSKEGPARRVLIGISLIIITITILLIAISDWEHFYTSLRYETDIWGRIEEDRGEGYVLLSLGGIIIVLIIGVILNLSYKWSYPKRKRKPKKKAIKEIKYPKSEE